MMDEAVKHYKAVATGRRSKVAGEHWENMIEASCMYYSDAGVAEITKTPEPMRPIRPLKAGQFVAVYTKHAQPDYKGTLAGGGAVVFEAKHTDTGRMSRSVILEEQERQLNRHEALGADCFVMLSFEFERYFRVPWSIFRDMKQHFGRKYVTPQDLEPYEIEYIGGIIHFLPEHEKYRRTGR